MSPLAYARAFWHGDLTGPAEWWAWAGVGLLSLAIAAFVVLALIALTNWSIRRWPGDLGSDADELQPDTPAERRVRDRNLSLIAVLGLACPVVVALSR